ncbi:MAG: hypothetical protein ABR585_12585 [Gemmatimonadaceae bacterium]
MIMTYEVLESKTLTIIYQWSDHVLARTVYVHWTEYRNPTFGA